MFPQETEEEISNRMNTIISRLQNDLIYDLYKSYRLSITLSSNGILSLLITHDSKVSKDNNA